ncbi:unnamed protein product [Phytophthora fragariaefolia]|uniref:Unnamed protein product n=1 Tax=Phytophthora fragariaefolia TaxID=1490495 RepID=A0A9W6XP48_9STRA|nr:unnamed protein product [Phytophthora fragariaefolia]
MLDSAPLPQVLLRCTTSTAPASSAALLVQKGGPLPQVLLSRAEPFESPVCPLGAQEVSEPSTEGVDRPHEQGLAQLLAGGGPPPPGRAPDAALGAGQAAVLSVAGTAPAAGREHGGGSSAGPVGAASKRRGAGWQRRDAGGRRTRGASRDSTAQVHVELEAKRRQGRAGRDGGPGGREPQHSVEDPPPCARSIGDVADGDGEIVDHQGQRAGDGAAGGGFTGLEAPNRGLASGLSELPAGAASEAAATRQQRRPGLRELGRCAGEYQQRLRGPPSNYASTHIYDGFISKVKHDGTISIEQFASRRPPLKPIHWRTTKRLSSPNLIGIVRLANREASLRATDEIYWAEVTFQGKSNDEYMARERGYLTLRLLQYLNEPGNALMEHSPSVGDSVAIIDCQTFVPEFIPVLIALVKQRQLPVPFQHGALLNLSPQAEGFGRGQSNGNSYENDDDRIDTVDITLEPKCTLPTRNLIRKVIQLSLLDPIVDIRRDEGLCSRLEQSLLNLVDSATLDSGQLKSFAEGIMYPVHCTQGPPGTGKSYLGVVVVRALLIVRDVWKQKNREVGDPPILVLSYKNHAIDEFLLDLLKSEPTLGHLPRHTSYYGRYYTGNNFKRLVRIGGGCTEPDLEQYRERNVAFSDPNVRKVSKAIDNCQELRDKWHKFRDCFAPIFEAQTVVSGKAKKLSAEESRIVQAGVPALSSALATLWELSEYVITNEARQNSSYGTTEKVHAITEDLSGEGKDVIVGDLAATQSVSPVVVDLALVLKKKQMLENADIRRLYNGIKHYDPKIDPHEVLYRWISGFRPLPACAYTEPCPHVCTESSNFCQDHSCKFTTNGEAFCRVGVVHKRLYCEQHLCSAEKCKSCRINELQSFCEEHACFVCLLHNEVAQVAVEEPPRNSCEKHPLCWGLDGMCSEVAEVNSSYCKAHAEDLYCKWISTRGEHCSEIAATGQYCGKHHTEVVAASARAATSVNKCQALTRKGKPCKSYPLPGSTRCRDHVGRSNQITKEPVELVLPNSGTKYDVKSSGEAAIENQELETEELLKGEYSTVPSIEVSEASPELHDADVDVDEVNVQEDDLMSSDSDTEDFIDAVQYDNEDEIEESEHLQHMRDVFEVEDEEVEELTEIGDDAGEEKIPWTAPDQTLVLPEVWHWDMELEERWNAILSVLNLWSDLNAKLQHELAKTIANLKIKHQQEVLRVNARVYEGKAVIGGTITGCVSRLETIRTTNPFAILVEEASEVMEPLLFSCFSSSTRKLEMIGDHMQLQPSVMGRIDFERLNRINISMFERLISAPKGNEVPSSVLLIQRRMRRNVCNLTRNFYDGITSIEDHEVCETKVIGGASRKVGAFPLLDACEGSGREVPGVFPHIFFWTHTGVQERASVGLSRVNKKEATMTCMLVKYLVHCGVPPKSIAVLTPYKGQLMLMRKMLMTTYGLKIMTKGKDPRPAPSCFMSTVDRFQGDEADIVIISLVIDGKSRTPFVKLQNRMIVLLSRARLGMYVVGNVEYFGETAHWQKTLALLENDAECDNTDAIDCTTYLGPRIGRALPICCPEHRESVKLAKEDQDLKLGFCTVVCSEELSCSHKCNLMCHWPHIGKHNKNCAVEVESPCQRHPRVLKCSVMTASAGKMSVVEALRRYQCDIGVDVSLPCGHERKMTCHAYSEIEAGRATWPVCNKTAIAPYVFEECKHILTCTCSEFDRYSKGSAPSCSEKVEYTPPCQHTVPLLCHDRQDYVSQARRLVCKEKVKVSLPRCGHETVVPCPTAEMLKQWMGESGPALNFVQEGKLYGPKDCFCKRTVKFQRRCGHQEMVRCERAFELAQNPSRCQEPVVICNPECGHDCSTTCYEKDRLYEKVLQYSFDAPYIDIDPLEIVIESDSSNFRNYGLNVQCSEEVWVSIGLPQCSIDRLGALIKETQRILGDKKLTLWSPEAARILPDMEGVTHIAMPMSGKRGFHIRKMKMLERFNDGYDQSSQWSRALFSPVEFPVFATLNRKLQSKHIDAFEMKDFASQQTLNGMEVFEATQDNLNRVVGTEKTSVLFGHLVTVKNLTNPSDIPKNKGKRGAGMRDWVKRQSSHGYDALYRDAKSAKKGGSWIVWFPHAIFPTHRVDITDSNRDAILKCFPEKSQVEETPTKIYFTKSNGVSSAGEEKFAAPIQAPPVLSGKDLESLRVLAASVSPLYEPLNVWYPWDGKTLSTGAAEAIPPRIEKALASKLTFIPETLVNTKVGSSKNPFGGINYLKNVQGQGKLKEDGSLFQALELLAVRKQDTVEARAKLEEYVTRICAEENDYAHPLAIVAIARLAARLSESSSSDIQKKLVGIFAKLYPEASNIWLNDTEVHIVGALTSAKATSSIMAGPVSVEDKWESLKSQYGCHSQAMEDILKLVGLKKVKQEAVNLFKNAMMLQQLSAAQRKKNVMSFNYCFVGNPGTGKTTVARMFANLLKDSQIRRTHTFVECTAQTLKDDGAAEFRLKLNKACGGVLFIDEAYELDPAGDFKGKPIVAELLTAAEDKRDDLSIILAGYEDEIQKKLYAYNDGLPSRFEEVVFEDFDAQDLEVVWDGIAQDRGWEYEKSIAKIACRRLAKAAGRKGFGNARAVRKLFDQAVKEAMARDEFDGILKFQTVDLLRDRPSTNPKLQIVLKEVEEKTGWRKIKEEIKKLVRISDENYERELKGQETVPQCLNRLFLGNPGTGKTTCAGYYGRILKMLHFLSNGEVVKKTAGDFVGSHVGESQTKTSQILEMSNGKVLVIDEAYNLNDNMYGKQVLDVLVEKVQGTENDDIAVLLIGYEHEMLEMLRTQNPGLMRRFPPQHAFQFEDYTDQELLDILEWNCAKHNVSCPYDVAEALLKQLALQKTQPNFGNAGAVEQLLKHAIGKAMNRPMKNCVTILTLEDVGVDKEDGMIDPLERLDQLYRMDEIKTQLTQLQNQLIVADREGSCVPEVGHFVFRGSPGTGKTTVARVMAEILHGMGVLATTKLVETSGLDLTAEFVGQTKKKVTDKLGEAKGGLLFIDEAYELGEGKFGEEAMTTLVAAMTDLSYAGMVIIIAGYPKDMDQMLDRNVGLKEPLHAHKGVGVEDPMKLLDGLYRMDQIRDQLSHLQIEMAVADHEGSARPEIGHFVFRGPPGTGKTTVARVMAQILHAMGALATTKLVETSGLDLTAEYVGQTKAKVTEKLVEAKGGLLFIDEAYDLGKGHFGEEAMTTLVAAMTDPSYSGMVIVLAADDGVAFLRSKAEKEDIEFGGGADLAIHQTFTALKILDGFGNGRDAVRVWKELLQCRAQRVFKSPEEVRTITAKDAAMADEIIMASRRPPDGPVLSQSSLAQNTLMLRLPDQQLPQQETPSVPAQQEEPQEIFLKDQLDEKTAISVEETTEVEAEEGPEVEENECKSKEERDPGVSDEDWEELERAKEAHAAHLDALRRARDQAKLEEEQRRSQAIQEKIRQICPCPAGFNWYKSGGGWRCGGGSHFVSDAQLNSQFTR